MRVFKYLLIILVFASVIWFFTKELNIAGVYTDGYHLELDTPKSEVIKLLEETPYFFNDKEGLARFCYDDSDDSSKTYLYFKYLVQEKEYLHVCFVATTWDDKTSLVYYNVVDSECESKLINGELKGRKVFINEFKEKVIELARNLN